MKRSFKAKMAAIVVASFQRLRLRLCSFTQSSALSPRICGTVRLANIAEGQHLASQGVTLEADGAITERNLLMKRGSAANRVTPCGAVDTPLGVCSDEAAAAGD